MNESKKVSDSKHSHKSVPIKDSKKVSDSKHSHKSVHDSKSSNDE